MARTTCSPYPASAPDTQTVSGRIVQHVGLLLGAVKEEGQFVEQVAAQYDLLDGVVAGHLHVWQ